MTDDELRALIAHNSRTAASNLQAITRTQRTLDSLITDIIRPLSERTVELGERAEESRKRAEENQRRSNENAELFRTLLAEAREDRIKNQKRFDAQQEVIRALLLRVTSLNEGSEEEE